MIFRSIPLSLLLVACAHGHEGSAHEAALGQAMPVQAAATSSVSSAASAEPGPDTPAEGPAPTLDITLAPRALPEAPKALLDLDWEHALRLSEPNSAKPADPARPRTTSLAAVVSVALRTASSASLWLALDGFTPRRVEASKGTALSALVAELTALPAGVHRLVCFATDGSGSPLARSDGSPLASELTFEYAPAGSAPVGASTFNERKHTPWVVQPRGTFNPTEPSQPIPLLVWHANPEQALLLRIEDDKRAQAFLQLKRGGQLLQGLGGGDYRFSLAAAGATDSVEWTISVNRDLAPSKPKPSASVPAPAAAVPSAKGR